MDPNPREHIWAETMRAERRGDAAAYERLLKDVADLLRKLVRHRLTRYGLSANDTEDLVQEVLIGLHTKRHTWDTDRLFLPWLHAIMHYKFVDAVRRLKRESRYRIDMTFDEFAELYAPEAADHGRYVPDVARHISSLPQGQQAVVRALAVAGASVQATARALDTSEGAVRVTFHRALQRLIAAADLDDGAMAKGKV